MPVPHGRRHTPRPTMRSEAPDEERDRGGDGRAGDGNHADLPMIRRIHHQPDAFSAAPTPRQIEPDDPSTAARVAGLVERSQRQGRDGKEGEHQRRETGLGAVHIAVGQVGSAGAQRRGGAVERLRGRSAEIGAGVQHAECELDVRVVPTRCAGWHRRRSRRGRGPDRSGPRSAKVQRSRYRCPQCAGERGTRADAAGEIVTPCRDVVVADAGTPREPV